MLIKYILKISVTIIMVGGGDKRLENVLMFFIQVYFGV